VFKCNKTKIAETIHCKIITPFIVIELSTGFGLGLVTPVIISIIIGFGLIAVK